MGGSVNGRTPVLKQMVEVEEKLEGTDRTVMVLKPFNEVFCRLLEIHQHPEDVCDALGVSHRIFYIWRQLGIQAMAKAQNDEPLNENEEAYLQFFLDSNRARKYLQRKLEARLEELVPIMEPREVTDALARIDKVKWSKASALKVDVSGDAEVVQTHGEAVAKLLQLVTDDIIDVLPQKQGQKVRALLPSIVTNALGQVVRKGSSDAEAQVRELTSGS